MTRKEAMRQTHQENALLSLGFTRDEAESLRRISMTLRRWHELECGDGNGCIERDEKTDKPRYFNCNARYLGANDPRAWHVIPDREKGAHKRLAKIITARNKRAVEAAVADKTISAKVGKISLTSYIQGDPRGAALYIIRPGDVPKGADVGAYYTRGICVY